MLTLPSNPSQNVSSTPEKVLLTDAVLAGLGKIHAPVYLVPSTSGISGNPTTTMTMVSLSSLQNACNPGGLVTVQAPVSTELKTVQAVVKRPTLSHSGQVITKVIITSNPLPGQSGTQQVCLAPVQSGSVTTSNPTTTLSQPIKIITAQPHGLLQSPTKTISVNQATLLSTLNKQPIVAAIPGTPPKQSIVVSKIAISPSKTPTKIMIPFNMNKSPQRIAPAPINTATVSQVTSTPSNTAVKPTTITMSPSKLIFRQSGPLTTMKGTTLIGQPQVAGSSATQAAATTVKQVAVPISAAGNVQPVQVPGSKFHYVRLVTTTVANSSGTRTATIVPVSTSKSIAPATVASGVHHQPTMTPGQVKITLPIAPASQPTITKVLPKTGISQQRILIPASSTSGVTQLRTANSLSNTMSPLPPGTALISTGGNMQSFVMVPAQYVTQFQQQLSCPSTTVATVSATAGSTPQPILPAQPTAQTHFVPIASAATAGNSVDTTQISQATRHHLNGRSTVEPNGVRPRKPCNCTKSQCLKLYCDCFANGEFCHNCNCSNCYNNLDHEEDRQKAIKACLDRNPLAFHPKIGKGKGCKGKDGEHERRHNKGCNCKRSGCLKNYCECYEAKIMCSNMCKCVGCKNFEESAERKTLMHLADAAEVRVQQQTAAKNKFSSQVQDVPSKPPIGTASGERLPFSFVTPEVVQATCQCLLARTEEGEKSGLSEAVLEQLVLEEFGRCLITIIDYANRTKAKPSSGFDSGSCGGLLRNSRASMLT